jgi:hypothetical protein
MMEVVPLSPGLDADHGHVVSIARCIRQKWSPFPSGRQTSMAAPSRNVRQRFVPAPADRDCAVLRLGIVSPDGTLLLAWASSCGRGRINFGIAYDPLGKLASAFLPRADQAVAL